MLRKRPPSLSSLVVTPDIQSGNELNPPTKSQTFSAEAGTRIDAAALAMTVPHQSWIANIHSSRCLCSGCIVTTWCIHPRHPINLNFEV
jgi:hypothetical protein